jgi:hypothetical protein
VEAFVDLSFVLAVTKSLGGIGTAAACYFLLGIIRLMLAKHFGDRALTLMGKKAEHARDLAREFLRTARPPTWPLRKDDRAGDG